MTPLLSSPAVRLLLRHGDAPYKKSCDLTTAGGFAEVELGSAVVFYVATSRGPCMEAIAVNGYFDVVCL